MSSSPRVLELQTSMDGPDAKSVPPFMEQNEVASPQPPNHLSLDNDMKQDTEDVSMEPVPTVAGVASDKSNVTCTLFGLSGTMLESFRQFRRRGLQRNLFEVLNVVRASQRNCETQQVQYLQELQKVKEAADVHQNLASEIFEVDKRLEERVILSTKGMTDMNLELTQLGLNVGEGQQELGKVLREINAKLERLAPEHPRDERPPRFPLLLDRFEAALKERNRLRSEVSDYKKQLENANRLLDLERRQRGRQRVANTGKVSDLKIEGKWKELRFRIRDLAHFLSTTKSSSTPASEVIEVLETISDHYDDLLRHKEYRREIIQAYLWRVIDNLIFQGESPAWRNDPRVQLQKLKATLVVSTSWKAVPKNFMTWLSEGAQVLDGNQSPEDGAQQLKELVTEILDPICSMIRCHQIGHEAAVRIQEDLHDILGNAFELYKMMLSSRAAFQVGWPKIKRDGGLPRSERLYMESVGPGNPKGNHPVTMLISPYLAKWGNADGENYDQGMVLVKSMVFFG